MTPFPLPAHQTGRADFPHPAFRSASWLSTWIWSPSASDASRRVRRRLCPGKKLARASSVGLGSLGEEHANALADVAINRRVGGPECAMTEIRRPAVQHSVQPLADFWPCAFLAGEPWRRTHVELCGADALGVARSSEPRVLASSVGRRISKRAIPGRNPETTPGTLTNLLLRYSKLSERTAPPY